VRQDRRELPPKYRRTLYRSMGNNGDEGEEVMKMWEENGILGNANAKAI